MKEYGELLGTDAAREFSSRVRDVSELLAELPVAADGRARPAAAGSSTRTPAT